MATSPGDPAECANCHAPLGDGPKRAPVHVGNGEGATECFCARCFVHRRAAMEVGRFFPRLFAALHCSVCGWESADFGRRACGQCGSRFVVELPPPRTALQAESGTEVLSRD
jgi:hypothetical protein